MSLLAPWWSLLGFLLPDLCLSCGAARERGTSCGLCVGCGRRLLPARQPACVTCGRPLFSSGADPLCGSCRQNPPAFERLIAAFSYQEPGAAVIRGLKFGRLDYLGQDLACRLAPLVARWTPVIDRVVPVPLHWTRRLLRGYNQAERIARPLARTCGWRYQAALRRDAWTPPQTSLTRADRRGSQRGSIRLAAAADVAGVSVLLVDDVTTTGATLQAAALALRRGGARRVIAAVAARTPGPEEQIIRPATTV